MPLVPSRLLKVIFSTTAIFIAIICTAQENGVDKEIENKINVLINKMTLAEKVGQMNQHDGFWEVTGPVPKGGNAKQKYEHLKMGWVGLY